MRARWLPIALAAALAACATRPPDMRPYLLLPVTADGVPLAADTPVRIEHPGVRLEIEALTPRGRELWLRERAGIEQDPLAARADGERFLTVRLSVEATADVPVHFESQSIRLWQTDRTISTAALDYTRAYELLRRDIEGPGPAAEQMRRFMRGLLDGAVDVPAGGRREGLLVFPRLPVPKDGMILLEIPFLQSGSRTYKVRVPFTVSFPGAASAASGRENDDR
ncbi:MAG: hypothetical protein D6738_09600 [Acidobacteria bacterium]|nr:MAG: hypothetical protein D6738_09600 [Acidobacteriota bacterium]